MAGCPPDPRQRDVTALEWELNTTVFWLPFCFQMGRSGVGLSDGCKFLPLLVRGQTGSASSSRCPALRDGLQGSSCVPCPRDWWALCALPWGDAAAPGETGARADGTHGSPVLQVAAGPAACREEVPSPDLPGTSPATAFTALPSPRYGEQVLQLK